MTGGLPAFDPTRTYTVDIFKASNPSIKGLLTSNLANLKHDISATFTVPEPGIYTMVIEDGKSCGAVRQFDLSACDTTNAVRLQINDTLATTGSTICVPLYVSNFLQNTIQTFQFSVNWDPTILQFNSVTSALPLFDPAADLNIIGVANGNLGLAGLDPVNPLALPGDVLFNVVLM